MTHTQRLMAIKEGKSTDRPAFAVWGPHMNLIDRNAGDLAKATIDYQFAADCGFIKVMPNGMYFTEAFGQKMRPAEHLLDEMWLNVTVNAINDPHEWLKIKVPSMKEGPLAREIEAVKRICDYYQDDVPVLPTVFSPFIWMGEMTGGYFRQEVIIGHFTYSEKEAASGLEVVAETNELLMEEYIKAGAAGFFLGYQCGMAAKMGKDMFEEYGKKYDLRNLASIQGKTRFNMAHVCHGDAEHFEWFLDYPVDAFNWADQEEGQYSMSEARKKTDKVLVGGLAHSLGGVVRGVDDIVKNRSDLSGYERDEIKARIKEKALAAIKAAGPKVVISGGCAWGPSAVPRFGLIKEVMEEIGNEESGYTGG